MAEIEKVKGKLYSEGYMSDIGEGIQPAQPATIQNESPQPLQNQVEVNPTQQPEQNLQETPQQAITPELKKEAGMWTKLRDVLSWGKKSQLQEKDTTKLELKKVITRRRFLQAAGVTIAAGAIASIPGSQPTVELNEAPEELYPDSDGNGRFDEVVEDEQQKIEEILGFSPEELGFDADMQIQSENGRYIFHIGQTHKDLDFNGNVNNSLEIIEVQKKIEQLLLKGQYKDIFIEGFSEKDSKMLDDINISDGKFFVDVPVDEHVWENLKERFKDAVEGKDRNSTVYYIYQYAFQLKVEQVKAELIKNPEMQQKIAEEDEKNKLLAEALGNSVPLTQAEKFEESVSDTIFNKDEVYLYLGANMKLGLEGKLDLHMTEDQAQQSKMGAVIQERKAMIDRIAAETDEVKKEKLENELAEIQKRYKKEVHTDRNPWVVHHLTASEVANGTNILPVTFGANHDFFQAVTAYNEAHPDNKYGLIYVRAREEPVKSQ